MLCLKCSAMFKIHFYLSNKIFIVYWVERHYNLWYLLSGSLLKLWQIFKTALFHCYINLCSFINIILTKTMLILLTECFRGKIPEISSLWSKPFCRLIDTVKSTTNGRPNDCVGQMIFDEKTGNIFLPINHVLK